MCLDKVKRNKKGDLRIDVHEGIGYKVVRKCKDGSLENWDCNLVQGFTYPQNVWIHDPKAGKIINRDAMRPWRAYRAGFHVVQGANALRMARMIAAYESFLVVIEVVFKNVVAENDGRDKVYGHVVVAEDIYVTRIMD